MMMEYHYDTKLKESMISWSLEAALSSIDSCERRGCVHGQIIGFLLYRHLFVYEADTVSSISNYLTPTVLAEFM